MFFDKLITSGNKKNNKEERSKWVSRPFFKKEVALHYGAFGGRNPFFIRRYLTIFSVNPSSRETIQDIKKQSVWKKKRGAKEILHWRTHYLPRRIFRLWLFFTHKDAFSFWTILSKHLSFVWLCVSSIKRGARRIMSLDELSFAILFERRTKRSSSSFAWYKRRTTRRTHSLKLLPMRFGSRDSSEFRLRYVTEMNWPRRPGKTPYSDMATFNSPLSHSFSDVIICFGEF